MEWTNLAGNPKYDDMKEDLAKRLPKINVDEGPRKGASGKTRKNTPKKPG